MTKTHFRLAVILLAVLSFPVSVYWVSASGQGQAGGGNLPGDATGGAALIFHKPDNPPRIAGAAPAAGAAGGGRISGGRASGGSRTRAVVARRQPLNRSSRGNAARSAPKPRYSEAEQQYKLAAADDPGDARAHAGLGNVYVDQGRFNEAVDAYRKALKISADYLPAYQPLAYSLVRLGRYPEAAETLNKLLQYDPNNAEIYNNLGFAYVHAGQYAKGLPPANRQSRYWVRQAKPTNRNCKTEMKCYPTPTRISGTPTTG